MRTIFSIATIFIVLLVVISCQSKQAENKTVKTDTVKMMTATADTNAIKIDTAGMVFASKKDPVCGMPVPRYLVDTTAYKGKIYGFCSEECKEEFYKNPLLYIHEN